MLFYDSILVLLSPVLKNEKCCFEKNVSKVWFAGAGCPKLFGHCNGLDKEKHVFRSATNWLMFLVGLKCILTQKCDFLKISKPGCFTYT